jgi:quinol monooxygenase YgiN
MAAQGGARPDPIEASGLASGQTRGQPAPVATGGEGVTYLRLTRGRFEPATAHELAGLAQALLAAMRRLPGYRSFRGAVDRAAGTLVVVSTWDSAEHARFSREALGDAAARGQALGVRLEPPEIYEVVADA